MGSPNWWLVSETTAEGKHRGMIGRGEVVWVSGEFAYAKRIFDVLTRADGGDGSDSDGNG